MAEDLPDAALVVDTVEEYETAVESQAGKGKPLLIQFTAEWCPRCPAFGDAIKALTAEYQFQWAVSDAAEPELVEHFEIKQLPAYVLVLPGVDPKVVQNASPDMVRQAVSTLCTPVFTVDADF